MSHLRHLFCAWLFLLLISGCASTPPVQQTAIRPANAGQTSFIVTGRIAIKHDGERSSATVRWRHDVDVDEILLFAPLGKVVARIRRDDQRVELDTSDKHYVAQDVEELTLQVLGWRLPLSGLQYWALSLPAPDGVFDNEYNANGQISLLRQDGWTIRYTRYISSALDSLPLRLTMQRDNLEIQLLIDEWEIPSLP